MERGSATGPATIGRYEVVALVGTGSFAAVYRARDPALDSEVAVKLLADHHSAVPELRERFIREARTLRRVGGGRIVTVFDIGEVDGQPYFVTELLGDTLADRALNAPLPPDALVALIGEIASCLGAAHERGVVHRDVKPSNLLVRSAGASPPRPGWAVDPDVEELVLADFGLARTTDATHLTFAGGTDGYAAPEQRVPGTTIDHRADVYAASVVVGQFADADPALDAALARGCADDPADRHTDAATWGADLIEAVTPEPAPATPRRRVVLTALAVALLIAIGSVIWTASTGDSDGPTIIGPTSLDVGEPARYRYEALPGASYHWIDSSGREFDDAELQVTPRGPGLIELTLVERVGDDESRSTMRIRVGEP